MFAFGKAIKISRQLYNKGLSRATDGNLSGAIEALIQSIEFNKNNYQARNLLGLIYYEIGQIGDALKQWIISSNLVKVSNIAMAYMQRVQNNPDDLYGKNDAVALYNQAISHIEKKQDDLAIIQLKKALDLNPKFLQAANFLAFCHLIQDNKEEALSLVKKILEIDINNKIAINYYTMLVGKPPKRLFNQQKSPYVSPRPTAPPIIVAQPVIETPGKSVRAITLYHIASFFIGAVTTFGLLYFFVMPGWVGDMGQEITALTNQIEEMTTAHSNETEARLYEISQLNSENRQLLDANASISQRLMGFEHVEIIDNARTLINTGQYEEAADILNTLNLGLVSENMREEATSLMTTAFTNAGWSLYNSGLAQFTQQNFENAISFFQRALLFSDLNPNAMLPFVDDAIYFLGVIAQEQGDFITASTYFTAVIQDHPNSNVLASATNRLAAITAVIEAGMVEGEEYDEE